MVSQSGMNAGEFVRYAIPRGIRCSKVISFGNGADLKAADFFEYLAEDPKTEIIAAYLEGIQDGPRLAQASALQVHNRYLSAETTDGLEVIEVNTGGEFKG